MYYVNKKELCGQGIAGKIQTILVKKHRVFCFKLCKNYKKLKKSKNLQIIIYKLCKLCDNMNEES